MKQIAGRREEPLEKWCDRGAPKTCFLPFCKDWFRHRNTLTLWRTGERKNIKVDTALKDIAETTVTAVKTWCGVCIDKDVQM